MGEAIQNLERVILILFKFKTEKDEINDGRKMTMMEGAISVRFATSHIFLIQLYTHI
jgi:hypothetical protein